MNLINLSILIFVLISNFIALIYASGFEDEVSEKYELDLSSITLDELENILCYFIFILRLHDIIEALHELLSKEGDLIYLSYLEYIKNILKVNKRYLQYLDKQTNNLNLQKAAELNNSDYFENIVTQIKEHDKTENKNLNLYVIFTKLELILKEVLNLLQSFEKHFCKIRSFINSVKRTMNELRAEIAKRVFSLRKLLTKDTKAIETKKTKEAEEHANISAHQLIGCCQDGKCGSLDGKKSQDKKNKDKSKKKKEKRKNKKEDQKEEDNEKEPQGEIGALLDEKSGKIFNEKGLNKQLQHYLLKDSVEVAFIIIQLLNKVLEFEQGLIESVTKIKSLFEILIQEKNRKYDFPIKKKLNDMLINKRIKRYLATFNKNPQMKINQQKYNLALKMCSSSSREEDSKRNIFKNYCPHCQCRKCKLGSYSTRKNIEYLD